MAMITHLVPQCGSLLPKIKYRLTTYHKMGWICESKCNENLRLYDPTLEKIFPSHPGQYKPKLVKISFKIGKHILTDFSLQG